MTDTSSRPHRGRHAKFTKLGLTAAVSALAMGMGVHAFAQDAAPAAAPDDSTVVVVTGVRASVQKSLSIKRRSVQVVDSVVAEDIGKLPDNNVVEALQRVTGVQVANHGSGEASGIFIRGMPDITTTWNGRNIFTASGRQLELQDIPSNLISRIDVYKTRSADQFEAGLGGQVDVFTHRPFDFKGAEVSVAARAIYLEPANKVNPNISLLASNRWSTPIGEVGALVNLSYARTQFRDENITAGAEFPYMTATPAAGWVPYEKIGSTDPRVSENPIWLAGAEHGLPYAAGSTLKINGVDVPYVLTRDAVIATDLLGDRERPAANIALQWKPNADSEYNFEYAYEGYRNKITQRMLFTFVDWWGSLGADPGSTVNLYPGTNIVKSRTVNFPFSFTSGENTTQSTDTNVFALNGKWHINDKLNLKADLSHVDSVFNTQFIALRATHVFDSVAVDFNAGGGVPSLKYGNNADAANPAMWNSDYFYDNANRNTGHSTALTVDGTYDADWGMLKKVSFGVHNDSHTATESRWFQDGCLCGPALSTYSPGFVTSNSGFFDGVGDFPRSWVVVNGDYLVSHADEIRRGVQAREPFRNIQTSENLHFTKNFDIDEKTTSAYVMGDFENQVFGKLLQTEIGVRSIQVNTDMIFTDETAAHNVTTGTAKAYKLLPSVTVRYDISHDMRLRFNYGETLRRPNFADVNPLLTLYDSLTPVPGQSFRPEGTGFGGNKDLKPTESKNVDVGYEWYFAPDSLFYTTVFRREIQGLVVPLVHLIHRTVPGYTATSFLVNTPVNASDGVMQGAEIGSTYFPKNLPGLLNGLGVQGSITILDSSQNIPIANADGVVVEQAKNDFFGVSKLSYNVTLMYDRGPLNMRLSHVWRDDWLSRNEARLFANPVGIWQKAEGFTDFQLNYNVNDKMSFSVDATNIFNQKSQGYYKFGNAGNADITNFNTFLISRSFAIGLRWKM